MDLNAFLQSLIGSVTLWLAQRRSIENCSNHVASLGTKPHLIILFFVQHLTLIRILIRRMRWNIFFLQWDGTRRYNWFPRQPAANFFREFDRLERNSVLIQNKEFYWETVYSTLTVVEMKWQMRSHIFFVEIVLVLFVLVSYCFGLKFWDIERVTF